MTRSSLAFVGRVRGTLALVNSVGGRVGDLNLTLEGTEIELPGVIAPPPAEDDEEDDDDEGSLDAEDDAEGGASLGREGRRREGFPPAEGDAGELEFIYSPDN